MKKKQPRAVKLIGNLRIRGENREQIQKRTENALWQNKVRAQQVTNQYHLELRRVDAALHHMHPGQQRNAVLMNRGILQKQFDDFKLA